MKMSIWILAKFLQTKTTENEKVRDEIEKLEYEIKRNQELRQEDEDSAVEEFRSQMEVNKFELIAEHIQEEREQSAAMERDLVEAYRNSVELRAQLRRLDIEKLAAYELMVNDMRHQKESLELQEQFRHKEEMAKQMESREIVQQLRSKQAEYQEVVKINQQASEYLNIIRKESENKFEVMLNQRNELIVSLVKGSKELENIRAAINAKKKINELTGELHRLQASQKIPSSSNAAAAAETVFKVPEVAPAKKIETPSMFDPFNPMAFFKSIKLDFNMAHAMQDFYADLQAKNQKKKAEEEAEKLKNLRPILRNSSSPSKKPVSSVRHVTFVEPDSSCPSSPTDSDASVQNTFTNISKSNEVVAIPSDKVEDEMNPPNSSSNEATQIQATNSLATPSECTSHKSAIEIQECRVIKPPGTALPKVIPFNLPSSTQTLTSSNITSESGFSKPSSSKTQPKRRNMLDFDTYCMYNKSSDTEDEEPIVNTGSLMFDFGNSDQLEMDDGDNEKFMLDFSDDSTTEGNNFL